jgi:phosphoglucosamine mutase
MLFGTSGIRGIYGKDVTEELALRIANVFAGRDVVVARDTRQTGMPLSSAVMAGVMARGKDAISLGLVPTPTLALATRKRSCNGIMVTASHNPPEYNGLKLFTDGREISREEEAEVEKAYLGDGFRVCQWDDVGKSSVDKGAIFEHMALVTSLVDAAAIRKRKPKVVIDCNGAGTAMTPNLLKDLGCEVIVLNGDTLGFSRPSEPNSKNLSELSALVPKVGADLGLAHDGDADRTIAVDEKGRVLPLDIQLAMMCQQELKGSKNRKIVSTMEASLAVREAVESHGGKITITPVGSLYVAQELEKQGALFGGEPCGEYVYEKGVHVPDGPLAAAKIIEMFVENGPLSALASKFKTHPMAREKFASDRKYEAVDAIKKEIRMEGRRSEQDGIRVDEEDGWFLIRASGTEPIVRLTMEYKSKEKLEKRKQELTALIRKKTGGP